MLEALLDRALQVPLAESGQHRVESCVASRRALRSLRGGTLPRCWRCSTSTHGRPGGAWRPPWGAMSSWRCVHPSKRVTSDAEDTLRRTVTQSQTPQYFSSPLVFASAIISFSASRRPLTVPRPSILHAANAG